MTTAQKIAFIRHASKQPKNGPTTAAPQPALRVTDDGSIRETNIHRIRKITE